MRGLVTLASVVAAFAALPAQDNPVVFLERAYFSPFTPSHRPLWFEGQPTVHYFLFNTFSSAEFQSGRDWGSALSVSPLFIARMRRGASTPVITPSYEIGPRLQIIKVHRDSRRAPRFAMTQFMTGVVHYSNGQAGCFYFGYTRATTGQCFVASGPDSLVAALRTPNTLSGDFSTSYIPINLAYRRGGLIPHNNRLRWQATIGVEFQVHPIGGLVGAMNREQAAEYGQHEWSVFGEWECRRKAESGVWRLAGRFTRRVGGGVPEALNRGVVEGSFIFESKRVGAVPVLRRIPGVRNMAFRHNGLFVRLHTGFDYYNIHFKDRKPFLSAGFVVDPYRLDGLNSTHRLGPDTKVGRCVF